MTKEELLPGGLHDHNAEYRVKSMDLDLVSLETLSDDLVESHEELLENLVAMRKKHNLTQETVAERMGVSQPTVAAFERYDANPTLSTIRRYALAVGAMIESNVVDRCASTGGSFPYVALQSDLQEWLFSSSPSPWASSTSSGWGAWKEPVRTAVVYG